MALPLSSDSLRLLARSARQIVRRPLGRGVDAALLPDNVGAHLGSLLRIVHTTKDASLEIYQGANDRRTWREAHPDPGPPLRARATGLQVERAAPTDEDKTLTQQARCLDHHVSQLQQKHRATGPAQHGALRWRRLPHPTRRPN